MDNLRHRRPCCHTVADVRVLANFVALAAAASLLSGCAGSPDVAAGSKSPTVVDSARVSKVRFNDESRSIWNAYFRTYTAVLADPSRPISDLKPYLSDAEFDAIRERIESLRKAEVRVSGAGSYSNYTVVDASEKVALVCLDGSTSRVLNGEGKDITPTDRPGKETLRLTFLEASGKLVLDRDERWQERSVC